MYKTLQLDIGKIFSYELIITHEIYGSIDPYSQAICSDRKLARTL